MLMSQFLCHVGESGEGLDTGRLWTKQYLRYQANHRGYILLGNAFERQSTRA